MTTPMRTLPLVARDPIVRIRDAFARAGSTPTDGSAAVLRMAPGDDGQPRRIVPNAERGDHHFDPDFKFVGTLTPASVLVPIVMRPTGATILLTRRTQHLHHHAGQISFPGGRADPEDADAIATALREAREEVGLPPERVEILGTLDTYLTRTGFRVSPVVGLVPPDLPLAPDPHEVAELFELPLTFLMDPANRRIDSREVQGAVRRFFVLPWQNYYIWGATAGMLINLSEVLAGAESSLDKSA